MRPHDSLSFVKQRKENRYISGTCTRMIRLHRIEHIFRTNKVQTKVKRLPSQRWKLGLST